MDEQKARRKNSENPLLQTDSRKKSQKKADGRKKNDSAQRENTQQNVYKLRILTVILVLLIVALIAAFISEIGIYGRQNSRTNGNTAAAPAFVQAEQMREEEPGQ